MKLITFFLILIPVTVCAQETSIPPDTSFTVYSTFIKEQKKFPFISIANRPVSKNITTATNIVYKTIGNRQLHIDIFYPTTKNKNGYPGVVMIHGGGWRSGDRTQTIPIGQQLAAKGYVAISVEYRLTPEAIYPAAVFDIKALIRWARANAKTYHLDQTKIATMGFSSGGQLAALVGTTNGLSAFEASGEIGIIQAMYRPSLTLMAFLPLNIRNQKKVQLPPHGWVALMKKNLKHGWMLLLYLM